MMKRANRSNYVLFALWIIFAGVSVAQEDNVKSYLELNELGDVPGEIEVSTEFLTVIEFEGHNVEEVNSASGDLFTITLSGNIITVRANADTITTDLFARVDGRTVLFKLQSDEQASGPRRYVVRESPEAQRDIRGFRGTAGAPRPSTTGSSPLFPQGLLFEADFFRPRQTEIILQYRLINESKTPIINDPYRLRIYYGGTSVSYEKEFTPAPGRPNFLAPGESEFGQIVIPQAPNDLDELELEWILTEVGPGTQHKLIRNLAELAETSPGSYEPVASSQADPSAPDPAASPSPTEPEAEAEPSLEAEPQANLEVNPEASTEPQAEPQANLEVNPKASEKAQLPSTEAPAEPQIAEPQTSEPQTSAEPEPSGATELVSEPIIKSTFDTDEENWYVWTAPNTDARASADVSGGETCVDISNNGAEAWHVNFALGGLELASSENYVLRYDAYVAGRSRVALNTGVILDEPPYTNLVWHDAVVKADKETYEHSFTLPKEEEGSTRLMFLLGKKGENAAPYRVCFDNIQLSASATGEPQAETQVDPETQVDGANTSADIISADTEDVSADTDEVTDISAEQDLAEATQEDALVNSTSVNSTSVNSTLVNSTFEAGLEEDWNFYTLETGEANVVSRNQEACFSVTQAGDERYHVRFLQLNHSLRVGQNYTFSFDAYSQQPTEIQSVVSMQDDPWTAYHRQSERLESEKRNYSYTFSVPEDQSQARVAFDLGGPVNAELGAYELCLDNIYLGEAATGQASAND